MTAEWVTTIVFFAALAVFTVMALVTFGLVPRCLVRFLSHLRTFYRAWWYCLTGRMPRKRDQRPDIRLSDEDKDVFGGLMITFREGVPGSDADRTRRQP